MDATQIAENTMAEATMGSKSTGSTGLDNAWIGLGLAIAGGLSTAIGAGMVFSERYIKLASQKVLAGGLGMSAGVMIYVSFVEIFHESVEHYGKMEGMSEKSAEFFAGLTFFVGMLLMMALDKIVNMIDPDHDTPHLAEQGEKQERELQNPASDTVVEVSEVSKDSKDQRSSKHLKAEEQSSVFDKSAKALRLMGLKTALAIALHNFPEGVATFVATLNSVQLGLTMCLGIAIHNIPEGFCVAVPYYYATGSRWKAFLWGTLSGLTEPLGALFTWAMCYLFAQTSGAVGEGQTLEVDIPDVVYGVLFGLVAGMMVFLSISELLPTAFKYAEGDNSIVAKACAGGMAIMWASMLLE